MKRFTIAFVLIIICITTVIAQTQQGINYQAVVRDVNGNILPNQNVSVKITIIQDSVNGLIVYSEIHNTMTNQFGLMNLVIGTGNVVTGNFSEINWQNHYHFIQTEIDVNGGINYELMGTSQFNSVPYSYYAESSGNSSPWGINNNDVYYNNGNVGIGITNPSCKLEIMGSSIKANDTLFQVKNSSGHPIFAVFPWGVRVWVQDEGGSGSQGAFAIGGISGTKDSDDEYFRVTPDSVRIYIREEDDKGGSGSQGSFAIGGISSDKAGELIDYFKISGNDSTEIINPSKARMFWYPTKNAFLIGQVLIEHSDSVGMYSLASGYESKAIGNYSQSLGNKSIASGSKSIALGDSVIASGDNSIALGSYASTNNKKGAFVYADYTSIGTVLNAAANDQFMVRARGGFVFYTDSLLSENKTVYFKGKSGYVGIGVANPNASLDIGGGVASNIDGTDDILVKDDAEINGDLYVSGNSTIAGVLDHSANPNKPKIYQQTTEPDIPANTSAFWVNTSTSAYYLILDVGGVQKKVELN